MRSAKTARQRIASLKIRGHAQHNAFMRLHRDGGRLGMENSQRPVAKPCRDMFSGLVVHALTLVAAFEICDGELFESMQ